MKVKTTKLFKSTLLGFGILSWQGIYSKSVNEELIVGMTQEFETLNPIIQTMSASRYISYMVQRPVAAINDKWDWACVLCTKLPSLANGLAKIIQDQGVKKLVANFEIQANAVWNDGTPVTGHDVKLAWEIGFSPNVSVGSKETYTKIEKIEVDLSNAKKFSVQFKEPRYDFYQLDIQPIPAHLEQKVWDATKNENGAYEKKTLYSEKPTLAGLYNGPYEVKEINLGSHVVVTANPKYWDKKPAIKKIILKLIPDTQTLEANLLSGSIDMISELGMTFDQALAFEKRVAKDETLKSKYAVLFREGLIYEHIDLNLRNPLLKDTNIRKALMHGVDRDKLSQALFEGKQKKAISNIHPLDPYFSENVVKYEFNPQKAKQLIEQSGWKKGADGIYEKEGVKLSFVIMTTAQNKTRELVEVFLQEEWKKIGVDIKIRNEPARVYFGETVRKALYPAMAMYAWVSAPDAPPKSTLHSKEIPTSENGWSGQNSGGWANNKVDKLLDQVFLEFSLNKRKDLMQKIQFEYTNEVPTIPLYLRSEIAVAPIALKGFQLAGHQYYSTLRVEDWNMGTTVAVK